MKIFVSSVISGYESFREAAAKAIETLGHEAVRAEQFQASAASPQQACLAQVRSSDLVVVLLGQRYGTPQTSGMSATHDEYLEARDSKPILAFIQEGIEPEVAQAALIEEVQSWSAGHLTAKFHDADDLYAQVIRAIHEFDLAESAGPADEDEMAERVNRVVTTPKSGVIGGIATLEIVVVPGPKRQVMRPSEVEAGDLARELQQMAFFGKHPVLASTESTDIGIRDGALVLAQASGGILVDELGDIAINQPLEKGGRGRLAIPSLIEEDIAEMLTGGLGFASEVLDRIDPMTRLTDVVVAAQVLNAGYMPWRTRAEHSASPSAAQMGSGTGGSLVLLSPRHRKRGALAQDPYSIADDFIVLLRRQFRQ